ncbi:hypothetical protein EC9_42140 [Rosistilla ulvae]|uniref:Uncharacterized protein n=1 Tax=Rosistilla ulvae TaxID=1930277 RepID=A0A517M560_9BACT|nr:hypothetical protein EC9_42140 [Rosistilla ulvae]
MYRRQDTCLIVSCESNAAVQPDGLSGFRPACGRYRNSLGRTEARLPSNREKSTFAAKVVATTNSAVPRTGQLPRKTASTIWHACCR